MIRPAHDRDLDAVLALLRAAKLPIDGVADAFELFLVDEDEGAIRGAAGLEVYGRAGLLRSVVVAPEARGRGLGGDLTDAILRRAAEMGIEDVYLLTETAADFFPRHGFERIGRADAAPEVQASPEFTTLCATTATVMVRRAG